MLKIRAILFDIDDTLIPSTSFYERALRAVGMSSSSPRYRAAKAAVKGRLGGNHPSSHNRVLYFKEMADGTRNAGARGVLRRLARYESALASFIRADWRRSERRRIVERLSRRFSLGIVSNETTRTQLIKLAAIDPAGRLFKVVVTSEEMGVEKPAALIFREALRRLKVKPSECFMVGDDKRADIAPMRRLGGHVFHVRTLRDFHRLEDAIESLTAHGGRP